MLFLCYLKQSKIIYIYCSYVIQTFEQACRKRGGWGGFFSPSFWPNSWPISTRGANYAHHSTTSPPCPRIFIPCDGPVEFIENQGWVSRKFHFFSTDKREHTAAICHMCQKLSFLHVSTIHISQWTVLCMYFTTSTLELNVNFNVFFNMILSIGKIVKGRY